MLGLPGLVSWVAFASPPAPKPEVEVKFPEFQPPMDSRHAHSLCTTSPRATAALGNRSYSGDHVVDARLNIDSLCVGVSAEKTKLPGQPCLVLFTS